MSKTEPKTSRIKDCQTCGNWEVIREHEKVSKLLDKAIESYDKKLQDKDFKPTIAEYLKLLQLEKELDDELQDTEVQVTWIGPDITSPPEK